MRPVNGAFLPNSISASVKRRFSSLNQVNDFKGTLRELESDSAVATTTVVSYAHILDLLDLPVDALRRMGDICVKTTDGNQQCFSVVGFLAEVHEKHGGPRLDILTSAASTAIQIHRDHAVLVMGKSKKDIELSGAENAHTRRRKLREHANDDRLHLRCARNQGPCLYTSLEELRTVKLLDVGYDGALSSTRRLQQSNDDGNFATLTADPYAGTSFCQIAALLDLSAADVRWADHFQFALSLSL
eukprot:scaffold33_cov135-Pinguiococcus_pyrenoidosus.AAC.9